MAAKIKEQPQTGFDEDGSPEVSLSDDAVLVELTVKFASAESDYEECAEIVKSYKAAKAAIVEAVKSRGLDNGSYRVWQFLIKVGDRNGGGFEVPAWTSKSVTIGAGTAKPSSNGAARED